MKTTSRIVATALGIASLAFAFMPRATTAQSLPFGFPYQLVPRPGYVGLCVSGSPTPVPTASPTATPTGATPSPTPVPTSAAIVPVACASDGGLLVHTTNSSGGGGGTYTAPPVQAVTLPNSFQSSFPTFPPYTLASPLAVTTAAPYTAPPVQAVTLPNSFQSSFPTFPPYTLGSPLPVQLPASFQSAFPTPVPTPAGGVYPISGAPTPIPTPAGGIYPISGAPTPIARPTDANNYLIISPQNLPTPFPVPTTTASASANSVSTSVRKILTGGAPLTTTVLGNGATFTSAWFDSTIDNATQVEATYYSVASTSPSSFQIQETPDTSLSVNTVAAQAPVNSNNSLVRIVAPITSRYWRVVFTAGNTQTALEINAVETTGSASPPYQFTASGQVLQEEICNNSGSTCVTIVTPAQTGNSLTGGTAVEAYNLLSNGATEDLARADPNSLSSGIMRVATGGSATLTIAAAAGATSVVSTTARRVWSFLATSSGTTAIICYDNASAASGTIVLETPATTTAGTEYGPLNGGRALVNGLTCNSPTGAPAGTFSVN